MFAPMCMFLVAFCKFSLADVGPYPPPYMVSRSSIRSICQMESDYYMVKYCTACQDCCYQYYFAVCLNLFNMEDNSRFRNLEHAKKPNCDASKCGPFYSYAVGSIRCRKSVLNGVNEAFSSSDENTLSYKLKVCIEFEYFKQCMHQWNDLAKYDLQLYMSELYCTLNCAFNHTQVVQEKLNLFKCKDCVIKSQNRSSPDTFQ